MVIPVFIFAETSEMGNFSNLNIAINGQRVEVEIDKDNPDIAKIMLSKPLLPRENLKISTPFTYKMPFPFSRPRGVNAST